MIDHAHPLLLGSTSPRRREILTTLGLPLLIVGTRVDEAVHSGEDPGAYLARVTLAKLMAVRLRPESAAAGAILVADTAVIVGDEVLGKPRDEMDAVSMLQALSGREHEVWTRFAVAGPPGIDPAEPPLHIETVATKVTFRSLDDEEIAGYAATGEGLDKAGAYAIQGIGAFAVARIEGSWSNVVGLPACEVISSLRRTGLLPRFPLGPAVA